MEKSKFDKLTDQFGAYGSWALWEHKRSREFEKSTKIIYDNVDVLNVNNVIIGLNISQQVGIWENFRGGKHDRKLKYAFNDTEIRGSYMTDLFKIEMIRSSDLKRYICEQRDVLITNIKCFKHEMESIEIKTKTRFVLLFSETSFFGNLFKGSFKCYFKENPFVFHQHYACRGTDKDWVESIWKKLEIKANFEETLSKYE